MGVRGNGCWVAFHTSPNIDPHATLAWWPVGRNAQAKALHLFKVLTVEVPVTTMWVAGYERFGVRNDVDVAILRPDPWFDHAAATLRPLHSSEWPIRAHVTAHGERQVFTFSYLGLHTPTEHRYTRLYEQMEAS